MSKKVSHIELHDGFFIPGLLANQGGGQFGKSLPPAGKTLLGLEMILLDNGSVEVEWGAPAQRQAITIGAANVKYVQHAASTKESEKAPKAK